MFPPPFPLVFATDFRLSSQNGGFAGALPSDQSRAREEAVEQIDRIRHDFDCTAEAAEPCSVGASLWAYAELLPWLTQAGWTCLDMTHVTLAQTPVLNRSLTVAALFAVRARRPALLATSAHRGLAQHGIDRVGEYLIAIGVELDFQLQHQQAALAVLPPAE